MPVASRVKTEDIIRALKETMGKVYLAAERLNCHHSTIYDRAKQFASVQSCMDHARGRAVDTAEIGLMKAVQEGEAWAICFTLKTLGKDRGYVERQQVTGLNDGPIQITEIEVVKTNANGNAQIDRSDAEA